MDTIIICTYISGLSSNETLKELIALTRKLEFNLYEHGITHPAIELVTTAGTDNTELDVWIQKNLMKVRSIIKFSAEIPIVDMNEVASQINSTNEVANRNAIEYIFERRVIDVVVTANIARIGSLEISDSITKIGDSFLENGYIPRITADSLVIVSELASEKEWPKLRELSFSQVWNWAHQNQHIFESFVGNSRVARAVNAYSKLLEVSEFDQNLIWSMIGIEALYVKGKVSVMEQVREKIQTFLGKHETNRKLIARMYDFRSRLMHGDLAFPGINYVGYFEPELEKYVDEVIETASLSVAILLSTLQEIIIRNWRGLDFSYKVDDIFSEEDN